MIRIPALLVVCLLVGFAAGAAFGGNQEQRSRRIPQFENEQLKVWKTIVVPNQPLSMHRHEFGRAIVALRGGTLHVVTEEGEEKPMHWETGNAYWLGPDPPGELHGDVNRGDEPIEVMVVELKTRGASGIGSRTPKE